MTEHEFRHHLRQIVILSSTLHQKKGHAMAEDLSRITADIDAVVSAFTTQQSNLSTAQGLLTTAEASNADLTSQVNDLTSKNVSLNSQVTDLTNQNATLQAQLAAAQGADNQAAVDALANKLEALLTPPAPNGGQ